MVNGLLTVPEWNWNLIDKGYADATYTAFNRTRMELKLLIWMDTVTRHGGLLTVPEWNWNKVGSDGKAPGETFNRTRMELKPNEKAVHSSQTTTFNRTRMELKLLLNLCVDVQV